MTSPKSTEFFKKYRDENETFIKDYDKRMEKMKKNSLSKTQKLTIRFFVILFFFGLGAATIGTVYFSNFSKQPDPVLLTIKASDAVKSGDVLSYDIVIANRGTTPLTDLSLIIEHPSGFNFESSTIASNNADHTYWTLQNIPRGSSKTLTIRGVATGKASDEKIIHVSLHYRVGDTGAEFISKQNVTVRISEPLISVSLDGPQLSEVEKEVSYSIVYGDVLVAGQQESVAIKVTIPKIFAATAVPAMDIANGWSDGLVRKGFDSAKRSGEMKLKGMFSKDANGDYPIVVQIGIQKNNQFIIADEKSITVHIAKNPLTVKLLINNSETLAPLPLHEAVNASVLYENSGTDELHNVQIVLEGDQKLIDWSKTDNPSYGALKDSRISWSKKEVSSLDLVRPGQKGEIKLSLGMKDAEVLTKYFEDQKLYGQPLSLELKLSASMLLNYNDQEQELSQEPIVLSIPLQSDTRVLSSLKQGDAGRTIVTWEIQNKLHEIEKIRLTTSLGKNTVWVGDTTRSAGDISYDPEKRTVVWTLNRMPLSVGSIRASFEVSLDQIHEDRTLTDSGILEAADMQTKSTISLPVPSMVASSE